MGCQWLFQHTALRKIFADLNNSTLFWRQAGAQLVLPLEYVMMLRRDLLSLRGTLYVW